MPIGTHRLPPAPQAPARPQYGPGNMPPLPQRPLTGASKMGVAPPHPVARAALLTAPPIVRCCFVPPPVMPPLPMTPPPANAWSAARNPSAHIVQRQYVNLRLEELEANRKPGKAAAMAELEKYLMDRMDPGKKQRQIP